MPTRGSPLLAAALPLMLLFLSAFTATAAAADASLPTPQKECCTLLSFTPGFDATSLTIPVLILTLPAPGLPDKKDVEVVGRLCECGGGGEQEEGGAVAAAAESGAAGATQQQQDEHEQPWVSLKVRGSTSARDFAKKSFALNFESAPPGQPKGDLPPSFLSMPMVDGKFALGGVQDDRTLGARSSLTFDAFREVMGRWAPRTRPVELFVRVEQPSAAAPPSVASSAELAPLALPAPPSTPSPVQYRGVYLATERVTRSAQRVDVAAYKPGAPAFLIAYENDNVQPGEPIFATRKTRLTFVIDDLSARTLANASALAATTAPAAAADPSSPSPDPLVFLTDFFNGLERALFAPGPLVRNIADADGGVVASPRQPQQQQQQQQQLEPRATLAALPTLAPYLDVAAAADYFLITELTKNPDGYRGSVKMHKDAGKPLVIGTPWDYGEAYGSCCGYPLEGYKTGGRSGPGASGGSAISANGWRFNVCADAGRCLVEPTDGTSQYFRRLWQDGSWRAGVAARWAQLRAGALNDTFFDAAIGANERALGGGGGGGGAAGRNYALWAAELPARPEEMLALERAGGGAGAAAAAGAATVGAGAAVGAALPPAAAPPAQFVAANLALRSWVLARAAWMDRALAAQADPLAPPDAYNAAAA